MSNATEIILQFTCIFWHINFLFVRYLYCRRQRRNRLHLPKNLLQKKRKKKFLNLFFVILIPVPFALYFCFRPTSILVPQICLFYYLVFAELLKLYFNFNFPYVNCRHVKANNKYVAEPSV